MKILFLSHTHRESMLKVGSSHLAREFALLGHQVMFISSPISLINIAKNLSDPNNQRKAENKVKMSLVFGKKNKIEDNTIIDFVPFSIIPYSRVSLLDNCFTALQLSSFSIPTSKSILKKFDFTDVDIVLMDDPSLAFMKKFVKSKLWVYRMTDIYSEMPKSRKSIMDLESEISKMCDKFIATSYPVAENFKDKYNKEVRVFENGVDYDFFQYKLMAPEEYKESKNRYIAVYIGNIDKRFNWDVIIKSAKKLSEVDIYIIGPLTTALPYDIVIPGNIKIIGPKPYSLIPSYLKYADVGLLPLVKGNGNSGRSPMKLYEYGASGLPVVANSTPELKRRNLPFVYLAENDGDFAKYIKEAVNPINNWSKVAKDISKTKSWRNITVDMLNYLSKEI